MFPLPFFGLCGPPQALRASSPKGTPLRYAGNFPATAKAVPLDRLSPTGERCRASDRVGSGWQSRRL